MSLFDEVLGEDYRSAQAVAKFVNDLLVAFELEMDESGISQADLAKKLELSPARVSQIFSGAGQNFTAATIAKMAHAFGKVARVEFDDAREKSPKLRSRKIENLQQNHRFSKTWILPNANDNGYWEEQESQSSVLKGPKSGVITKDLKRFFVDSVCA